MTSNGYTNLIDLTEVASPCIPDPNIIWIGGLENQIAEKKAQNEAVIVKTWMDTITKQYIEEKIVEAEANHKKTAVLIRGRYGDNYDALFELFMRCGLRDKIRDMLDPSISLCKKTEYEFLIYITWAPISEPPKIEKPSCCIIL